VWSVTDVGLFQWEILSSEALAMRNTRMRMLPKRSVPLPAHERVKQAPNHPPSHRVQEQTHNARAQCNPDSQITMADWQTVVSTEGGLAILGLVEDSPVACANRPPQLEGARPATSAAEAATLSDARGTRPATFELTPVQTRRSNVPTGTGGENTLNHLANFLADGAPASSRSARTQGIFQDLQPADGG